MRWVAAVLMVLLATACSELDQQVGSDSDSEQRIREQLEEFFPKVIEESVHGLGSGRERWESKWASRELLALIEGENRREAAFYEGLEYDEDHLDLKPPTPRSWWLPVPAEGTWTFEVIEVALGDSNRATAAVLFTGADYDGEQYPEPPVIYRMRWEDELWRIDNIEHGEKREYSLRGYLTRPVFMSDWPVLMKPESVNLQGGRPACLLRWPDTQSSPSWASVPSAGVRIPEHSGRQAERLPCNSNASRQ